MQEGERSRCGEVVVVVVVYGSSSSSNTVDGRNPAPLHSQLEPKWLRMIRHPLDCGDAYDSEVKRRRFKSGPVVASCM